MGNDQLILLDRAKKIAAREEISTRGDSVNVVVFRLIPELYCIEGNYITEVLTIRDITSIPGTPGFVVGVMNVRGKIISVVNLKRFFHLKEIGLTEQNKIIVIKHDQIEFGA